MNRRDYIRSLAANLRDLSETERNEALKYYNGYFDEAGSENEAEVIRELGSPESLAATIRSSAIERGENVGAAGTQAENNRQASMSGCYNKQVPPNGNRNNQVPPNGTTYTQVPPNRNTSSSSDQIGRIILFCVLAVVSIPFLCSLVGILLGFLGMVFGGGIGLMGCGLWMTVTALIRIASAYPESLIILGTGLLAFAVGTVLTAFGTWFCGRFFPWIWKLCQKCFHWLTGKGGVTE